MNPEEIYYQNRANANLNAGEPNIANLADAYEIQKANLPKFGAIAAWKLGGSTATTQKIFSTDSVYFGPICARDVFVAVENVAIGTHLSPVKGEVEVCFRLSRPIELADLVALNETSIHQYIASVMPAVEFPWSPFPLPGAGLKVLVADRCASGALVIGPEISWSAELTSQLDADITLCAADVELAKGEVKNIIGGPLSALLSFIHLAVSFGFSINAGDLISTGGCSPCVEIPLGQPIEVNFSGLLGAMSFSLIKESV